MNLNEDYTKLDPSGVEKALTFFPDQIITTFKQAINSDIPKLEFDAVLISGMGGSSNAAKILESVYESDFKVPYDIDIHNDYSLPIWCNDKTLVIANSYSGNTEETLSGLIEARKRGCITLAVTTGGKLAEMIRNGEVYGVVVDPEKTNPTGFPKTGLGVSIGALFGAMVKVGLLKITTEELSKHVEELIEVRKTWNVKEMAENLHGSIPVLFGGRPFIGALNAGRNAMCEISRNFTEFYDFPEVNHVLVEAVGKPSSALAKKYLFFESNFNSDRVKLRYQITKDIFKEQGLTTYNYSLVTSSVFAQSLELAHYCAWLGFYISMLDDTDPGPEPWILKLKDALSKSVN
ncbi:MAG: SIS domain-containing protein [Microgenomates group bacterium]